MVQRLEERAPIGKHRPHDTVGGRYRLLTHTYRLFAFACVTPSLLQVQLTGDAAQP